MPKHPRKRQKTVPTAKKEKAPEKQQQPPLGAPVALDDEASKDDEERRLESLLFGTAYIPNNGSDQEDDEYDNHNDDQGGDLLGNEFQGMGDGDLFYIDSGEPSAVAAPLLDTAEDSENTQDSDSGSDSEEDTPEPIQPAQKRAAWTDPSDAPISVPIHSTNRLRKLRDAPDETTVGGKEYERRLRRVYEGIHGVPDWALKAKSKSKSKRPREDEGDEGDEDDEDDGEAAEDLLNSTAGILAHSKTTKGKVLSAGILPIERLRDANQSSRSADAGEIKSLAFHPSDRVPVLCVASKDRRVRLFNIDAHTSPLLSTLHIPSLPTSNTTFHPSGSQLLLTGPRPFFHVHDLQTGATTRSARGLWGTTFHSNSSARANNGGGDPIETTAFSPDGSVLAIAGRGGYVHLVDWKAGSGQVVGSLKMGSGAAAGVKSLWWTSDGGAAATPHLAALTNDSEIFLWDVGQRSCLRRWKDEGGFRGASRVMRGSSSSSSSSGGYMAIGSTSGFVNVYGSDAFSSTAATTFESRPKPLKTIANLTTPVSTVEFNHDAQLMAIASREGKDALRMIHLPTLTSFSNWPTSSTPLGHVTALAFSAKSEFVAIGNTRGRVLLYGLGPYRA